MKRIDCPGQSGVALVIVLLCMVFLTALSLSFFLSSASQLQVSKSYSSGSNAQLLSEGVVNIVTSQINNATLIPANPDPKNAANAMVAWISQPGLLRTFGPDGKPIKSYKLYSSDNIVVDGSFDPAASVSTEVPPDWKSHPARFTDLNQPVTQKDSTGVDVSQYPIIDGNGLTAANGPYTYTSGDAINGFEVNNPPLSGAANVVPMPVQWLYQLRDGTLASADNAGQLTPAATQNNPIVARMAFWTDDETCKTNINTAAGDEWANTTDFGSFAGTPHASTRQELALALNQPAQKEFQRYPGHPATNYLSAIFPGLNRQNIADLTPRVVASDLSSLGGTRPATGVMGADSDRLYATVDELRFKMDRSANTILTKSQIERADFFLTAHSRAPELNLFNQPRVTIWPEPAAAANRTPFDNLIAFCSTIGSGANARAYYFVRSDSNSPTVDYAGYPRNRAVYAYLQGFLNEDVPGFGGKLLANYPQDKDQILTEIYDYIRCTNLIDKTNSAPYTPAPTGVRAVDSNPGSGQVIPIEINNTRGFGRTSVIQSPMILFHCKKQNLRKAEQLEALLVFQTFAVADGVTRFKPNLRIEVEGLDKFAIDGISLGMPASSSINFDAYANLHENGGGNSQGFNNLFFNHLGGSPNVKNIASYPFRSGVITLPAPKTISGYRGQLFPENYVPQKIAFKGGEITVKVFPPGTSTTPIQIYTFEFPDTDLYPPYVKYQLHGFGDVSDDYNNRNLNDIQDAFANGDYLRSLEPQTGDMRLVAASGSIPKSAFRKHELYDRAPASRADGARANNGVIIRDGDIFPEPHDPTPTGGNDRGPLWGKLTNATYDDFNADPGHVRGPAVPSFITSARLINSSGNSLPGDWDNATGDFPDGGLINKPDEGETGGFYGNAFGNFPYFSFANTPAGSTLFSPNRQIPSAVVFGSLSTGVKASQAAFAAGDPAGARPWQTLLFCPNPAAGNGHPGFGSGTGPSAQPPFSRSPDHLLLDLFTMPVVEPYAISEPFSTAGKINLNCQIAPFTYISRKTALMSALRSTQIAAIPTADGLTYKKSIDSIAVGNALDPAARYKYRHQIDLKETLGAFDARFAANEPFRSASEICNMYLVPEGQTLASVAAWWNSYALTGDNLREAPYADLYGKLTTKSNTFTVHMRVQTLQKPANDPQQGAWNEGRGQILSEYRGSVTVERYLDPTDARFASGTLNPDTDSLNPAYRFRVVNTRQFAP